MRTCSNVQHVLKVTNTLKEAVKEEIERSPQGFTFSSLAIQTPSDSSHDPESGAKAQSADRTESTDHSASSKCDLNAIAGMISPQS